jgi:protease IV
MRAFRRLFVVLLVVVAVAVVASLWSAPSVKPGSVLLLDIAGSYVDEPSVPFAARLFGERKTPLAALLSELRKAEHDARLAVVVLRLRKLDIGWGKAQEIRDAVTALRTAGRHPIAYLEVEDYGANLEYFVGSAAEQVYLSPASRTPFVGMAAEYLFLGGLWEKFGVQVEVERVGEYKSAAEIYAAKEMSEPHRVMANALLDSISQNFVRAVAEGRGLAPEQVSAAIDAAPVIPAEMKERKLIDGIAFLDEVIAMQGERPLVKAKEYAAIRPESVGIKPEANFALIYGTGAVVTGEGGSNSRGSPQLAAETVSRAFQDAAEDPSIRAIIFRVDSPGGSPLASDIVWRATQQARAKGKPIIASFSDVAASGGYYAACGVDAIVAEPTTLTGSIGVFVLRPIVGGLLDKLGIGVASLTRGAHADLLLSTQPLKPDTRALVQTEVKAVYDLFVSRVAEGRKLSAERVDEIGRGRVWTGVQAHEVGLVDELGGLHTAVMKAKEKVGLRPEADVMLVAFPAPEPLAVQIREALEGAAVRAAAADSLLPQLPASLRRVVSWLSSVPSGSPVLLPPVAVEIR